MPLHQADAEITGFVTSSGIMLPTDTELPGALDPAIEAPEELPGPGHGSGGGGCSVTCPATNAAIAFFFALAACFLFAASLVLCCLCVCVRAHVRAHV